MNTEIYRITDPIRFCADDNEAIDRAGRIIREGGLVAFPTETVYGLGASAFDSAAADAVYRAKGRPSDNPLIVHVSSPEEAELFAYVNDTYKDIAKRFMPGAVTVILPKRSIIPDGVTGGLSTVAVRCPAHPVAAELIRRTGVPIAAPSANLSGKPSPTRADHVIRDLSGRINMIIDGGDCVFGLESTVLKPEGEDTVRILRPGAVTAEMLSEAGYTVITDRAVIDPSAVGAMPQSPGMKYKHYSPEAEVILLDISDSRVGFAQTVNEMETGDSFAVICTDEQARGLRESARIFSCGKDEDGVVMARTLFSALRAADDAGVSRIYVPLPDKHGIGLAVYNRVIRAAGGRIIKPNNQGIGK